MFLNFTLDLQINKIERKIFILLKYILIGLQKYYKTEQNGKNVIFLTMIKMCKKMTFIVFVLSFSYICFFVYIRSVLVVTKHAFLNDFLLMC